MSQRPGLWRTPVTRGHVWTAGDMAEGKRNSKDSRGTLNISVRDETVIQRWKNTGAHYTGLLMDSTKVDIPTKQKDRLEGDRRSIVIIN